MVHWTPGTQKKGSKGKGRPFQQRQIFLVLYAESLFVFCLGLPASPFFLLQFFSPYSCSYFLSSLFLPAGITSFTRWNAMWCLAGWLFFFCCVVWFANGPMGCNEESNEWMYEWARRVLAGKDRRTIQLTIDIAPSRPCSFRSFLLWCYFVIVHTHKHHYLWHLSSILLRPKHLYTHRHTTTIHNTEKSFIARIQNASLSSISKTRLIDSLCIQLNFHSLAQHALIHSHTHTLILRCLSLFSPPAPSL